LIVSWRGVRRRSMADFVLPSMPSSNGHKQRSTPLLTAPAWLAWAQGAGADEAAIDPSLQKRGGR
jgi:hypothetical protein